MMPEPLRILLSGDLVLDEPDGAYWLSGIAPAVRAADLAVGHLEVPHTTHGAELAGDVPAPGAPPENLAAIAGAGFAMLSLAGNHIADCGARRHRRYRRRAWRAWHGRDRRGRNAGRCLAARDCPARRAADRPAQLQLRRPGKRLGQRNRRGVQLPARRDRRWLADCACCAARSGRCRQRWSG